MDWQVFTSTFLLIFLAEMGDKTQFAALAASSQTRSTVSVLIAVVSALALAGTIGVLFGRFLGDFLNPLTVKWISGGLFIAAGIWTILSR
jgi:putative Ca2+/H+ antiporter (TMEM165/GDT1 family)